MYWREPIAEFPGAVAEFQMSRSGMYAGAHYGGITRAVRTDLSDATVVELAAMCKRVLTDLLRSSVYGGIPE